ncbi:MAG: enoyl-CoA hydratase/isomerase family protein [Promethearchaeota archaeon]
MTNEDDVVLLEKDETGQIATIWLNRPKKRNAFNWAVFKGIGDKIDEIAQNDKIRVILIRAKGPHFSGGIDVNTLGGNDPDAPKVAGSGDSAFRYRLSQMQQFFHKVTLIEKPVIAIIQGFCLGAGFEYILSCDFRYAMEDAIFDMAEGKLGILPDLGGTTRLLRLIGNSSYAKEVVIAARRLTGKDGFRMGFVNGISSTKEGLEEQVSALVKDLIRVAPLAVGMGKRLIDSIYGKSEPEGLVSEAKVQSTLIGTEDFRKRGIRSLIERKDPEWEGK